SSLPVWGERWGARGLPGGGPVPPLSLRLLPVRPPGEVGLPGVDRPPCVLPCEAPPRRPRLPDVPVSGLPPPARPLPRPPPSSRPAAAARLPRTASAAACPGRRPRLAE